MHASNENTYAKPFTDAFSYDPAVPMRVSASRGSTKICTDDMARVMTRIAQNSADGTVTKDDLNRAGFSNGEIDACFVGAVQVMAARLARRGESRLAPAGGMIATRAGLDVLHDRFRIADSDGTAKPDAPVVDGTTRGDLVRGAAQAMLAVERFDRAEAARQTAHA